MQVSVVYESMYGNTSELATAIADAVRSASADATVTVARVGEASYEAVANADLLIVGGPTHALSMSRASTRRQAVEAPGKAKQPTPVAIEPGAATGPGVREWLDGLPPAAGGRAAAAFDTRLSFPLSGGAARPIARRLRRRGYAMAGKPRGFVVARATGPL